MGALENLRKFQRGFVPGRELRKWGIFIELSGSDIEKLPAEAVHSFLDRLIERGSKDPIFSRITLQKEAGERLLRVGLQMIAEGPLATGCEDLNTKQCEAVLLAVTNQWMASNGLRFGKRISYLNNYRI